MHPDIPELRQLAHAVALADLAHFGRAAEAVALSQPAFSRSIQALERRYGCVLFERARGRALPTAFGRAVVGRARRILHDAAELRREITALKGGDTGEVGVSVGPFAVEIVLPGALRRLVSAHPKLAVRARVRDWQDLAADVASETVDFGLGEVSEAGSSDRLETELLATHAVAFVCRPAHPLRKKRRVSLSDVVVYPFAGTVWPARGAAMLPPGPFAAGEVEPASGRFFPSVSVDRPLNVKDLVRETDALTTLTRTMCADELEAGALAIVPFSAPWLRLNYGFLWRRGRMKTPAALAFAEAVREAERDAAVREADLARRFP